MNKGTQLILLGLLLTFITTSRTATPEEVQKIEEIVTYFKQTCSHSTDFPNINWLCQETTRAREIGPYSKVVAVNALYILAILNAKYRNPEKHPFKDISAETIVDIYLEALKEPFIYYDEPKGGFGSANKEIQLVSRS